jgi:hydroxymethylpyrimidine/phosphomethylpyrimidine kinase
MHAPAGTSDGLPGARRVPVVLTVAGSDSGGGAGIQADLKTFSALGCFGTTAITCVTAQNPDEVRGVQALSPAIVRQQVETVCDGFPIAAVKTGMLYAIDIVACVAETLAARAIPILVVDPVMIATSGTRLLRNDAIAALRKQLLPLATVTTPNIPEAEALTGLAIKTVADQETAARAVFELCGCACVVKGGHLELPADDGASPSRIVDVLYDGSKLHRFVQPRLDVHETHGTGCTFAAACTAGLAHGLALAEAIGAAQAFVAQCLARPFVTGKHTPLGIGRDGASRF